MRIVIDLQPCQNGSRNRGIGRHSMAMTKAMIALGRGHEYIIALNQSFAGSIDSIRKEFSDLLPQSAFAVFSVPRSVAAADPNSAWRNRAAEMARSHFLESLSPDLVFIPSLIDGFWDDTIVSVEKETRYLTAATLYDLIPLEDIPRYLGGENDRAAYFRRLNDMRRADLILPISNYVAREAITKLSLRPDKVVVALCGVEEQFKPPLKNGDLKAKTLALYGITRPYVMNASPLEPRKNLEGLIAGFASMTANVRDDHQLVLIGKMTTFARNYLQNTAKAEGIAADGLVLPGYVPDRDLPALYHYSSVFAFPSFSEGFGLPLLEAMACGTPVVGSDRTSIPEVIDREDLICDPSNPVAVGRTIERILVDKSLQKELREFGPRRAANFTWEKSAATVLDAFESLHRQKTRSGTGKISAIEVSPVSGLQTMAYVMPSVPIEHRLAGVNNSLASALSDCFELTIIKTGVMHPVKWKDNCEVRHADWFDGHAGQFDYILYGTDFLADAAFRRLMNRHKGSTVLVERLSPPSDTMLIGRQMFDGARQAILDLEGLGTLASAVDADVSAEHVAALLYQDIEKRSEQIFCETDARSDAEVHLGIISSVRSEEARRAFRARVNIADDVRFIVAFASGELAARDIVHQYRAATATFDAKSALLIFLTDPHAKTPYDPNVIFGNVIRMSGDLDPVYCGLLSAADMVIIDDKLPVRITSRLENDTKGFRTLPVGDVNFANQLSASLASLGDKVTHADAFGDRDITGTAQSSSAATVIRSRIQKTILGETDRAMQRFVASIPSEVRGVKPDANDLAQLAISLSLNEVLEKPTFLYIDVTAFAGLKPSHRMDLSNKRWLKALFQQGGRYVQAVRVDGDQLVVAHQFAAKICGIDGSALQDHVVNTKSGDRVVGFDLFHSFTASSFDALLSAQDRGLSVSYIILGSLALNREEFLPSLAQMVLAWIADTCLTTQSSISVLPQISEPMRISKKQRENERVTALIKSGFNCHILVCEGTVSEPFSDTVKFRELSSNVLDTHKSWNDVGYQPILNISHKKSAASYGHVINGHLLGSYSLAIINRKLARTLEYNYPGRVRYLPVETVSINHTESVPAEEKALMIELSARQPLADKEEIVISHHYPVLVPDGDYKLSIALFFWEESHIPVATIKLLSDNFDAIIAPAQSVTNALIGSGLSIPVATIGQPVDVDAFVALAELRSQRTQRKEKTFLHISSGFKRKGIDVLLSAWAKAFTSADHVCLVIKTFPNPHNDVEAQISALRITHPDLAKIVVVNRDVDAHEMPKFYADADVIVLPSRGEGYNLPALEAMAAGLPMIVTGYGGHRDFCNEQDARLISYHFTTSESHVGGQHSMWVEPDIDDLVAALREQVDEQQHPVIEARRQHAILSASYESDETRWLRHYDEVIGGLLENAYHKPARIAWVSTWAVQCGIAQYSGYLLNNLSEAAQGRLLVICDTRTQADSPSVGSTIAYRPVWEVENVPKFEAILGSVCEFEADAVVVQHQDGLLSWKQLGQLAHDPRLTDKTTIIVLHNAGNMVRAENNERLMMLEGLGKMSRVLVHNIADVNLLLSLGLSHNVGLLPHGAIARDKAPWPRKLTSADAPIIGCHGFFFVHKGIDKLIRAAAILRERWPHLKLRLVNARFPGGGHDAYIRECKALAKSLGIADAIEWHQDFLPIEEIDTLLAGCDVIALPYDESDDSASGAVRVSLTSMIPLVATKVKIFAELGNAAAWAANNDPQILADTIDALLKSPEQRRTVQAAMHDWLSEHDWTRVANTLEGMIEGLVKQKRLDWGSNAMHRYAHRS